jgi:hypothetical protein
MKTYQKKLRSTSGSALSEMPPALFVLLFFAVFPLVNLISLGIVFASCLALNNVELREAARTPHTQLGTALSSIQNSWASNGLGRLSGVNDPPTSEVLYSNIGSDVYVAVSTTFLVKPFLTLPFFDHVPALGAPWSFTTSGKRVLENPSYAYQ